MNNQPGNPFSTPERRVNYVAIPPPITPLNARVAPVGDMNINPVRKNPPPQNQQEEYVPINLFGNGDIGGRKRSSKKHRRGKKTKRIVKRKRMNKNTRRFFRFGGMDPTTPPNSPRQITNPPSVVRAPRVPRVNVIQNIPPEPLFQGQNLMGQFNAEANNDEEGYTSEEDMMGGGDKRSREYTTSSQSTINPKKPRYSNNTTYSSMGKTTTSSVDSLASMMANANLSDHELTDDSMSATNGNTKGGYRRKTKRRISRKRRTTRK